MVLTAVGTVKCYNHCQNSDSVPVTVANFGFCSSHQLHATNPTKEHIIYNIYTYIQTQMCSCDIERQLQTITTLLAPKFLLRVSYGNRLNLHGHTSILYTHYTTSLFYTSDAGCPCLRRLGDTVCSGYVSLRKLGNDWKVYTYVLQSKTVYQCLHVSE